MHGRILAYDKFREKFIILASVAKFLFPSLLHEHFKHKNKIYGIYWAMLISLEKEEQGSVIFES